MKHHILVKYTPDVSREEKARLLPEIRELFENTCSIEGIHAVNLYPNCVDRANRYDLMIVITMEKEALPAYDECEWHKKWKEDYGHLLEKKAIFDCE